jgi:hypothetical protein
MRTKWLNLVLLLTNRIYSRKQSIAGQNGLAAAANIFTLIVLEVALGAVSLPLYVALNSDTVTAHLTSKGAYAKVVFDYNLRRILTLTGVGIVFVIWGVKLMLILAVPTVYGPLQLFTVSDLRPADILTVDMAAETGIQTARVIGNMPRPELTQVKKVSGGDYVFTGKGQPNSTVVLLLSDGQTAIYTAQIGDSGLWEISHLRSNFKLNDGNHSVIVFSYDKALGVRSETAPNQYFKVTSSWLDVLAKNIDQLANWSVAIIIILGIFLTFLTL